MEEVIQELKLLLNTQEKWVKVHVAEYLIWLGNTRGIREAFLEEEARYGETPKYRIGVWRILAQTAIDGDERRNWEGRILSVFGSVTASDRLHAIETLSKLEIAAPGIQDIFNAIPSTEELDSFNLYALWNAAYYAKIGKDKVRSRILKLIRTAYAKRQFMAVTISAYILRYLGGLTCSEWQALSTLAMTHGTEDISSHAGVLAALWAVSPKNILVSDLERVKLELTRVSVDAHALPQLLSAMAIKGGETEFELVHRCYMDARKNDNAGYDPDIHAASAYALLTIDKRCKFIS